MRTPGRRWLVKATIMDQSEQRIAARTQRFAHRLSQGDLEEGSRQELVLFHKYAGHQEKLHQRRYLGDPPVKVTIMDLHRQQTRCGNLTACHSTCLLSEIVGRVASRTFSFSMHVWSHHGACIIVAQ